MNERIRKLAERAGFSYMPSDYPDMADSYKCHDFELEKFAELIVRECAEVADNADAIRPKWRSIGKWVREHFGVE